MPAVSQRVIDALVLSRAREAIEREADIAAPGVFDPGIFELGKDLDQAALQYGCAFVYAGGRRRFVIGAAAEEQAIIERQPEVVKIVFGIKDDPALRNQL